MASKKVMATLAPLLIVAMVAALRSAEASRPSSDASGVQDGAPLIGMRHRLLAETTLKCPNGYKPCNGQCANVIRDADNCGSCGRVCPDLHQCLAGNCTKMAAAGPVVATGSNALTKCAAQPKTNAPRTACYYDTKCSYNNCGGCGIRCPAGSYCYNGRCICLAPNCLCKVYGKLKCIPPGHTCPSTGKVCCPAGKVPCATGCCWPCNDPKGYPNGLCYTSRGPVCCPTSQPGTNCHGPPNNRQCCPNGYWTGPTTQKCCDKAGGEKPTKCEAAPGDRTPPTICCTDDLPCKYNANVPGYVCTAAECPPIDKCTDFTDALTDPPCCCKKCTAPYVPMCPDLSKTCNEAGGSGCGCKCPPNLLVGNTCCATKVCGGKKCCPKADDVCYTSSKGPACCPKARWDNINKVCCTSALCATKGGNVCCPSGTPCRIVPGQKNDVCCATAQWTGITTRTCCPADKTPAKCEPKAGDTNPPTICCDPDQACRFNANTNTTGQVIGYSCIVSSCPPPFLIDEHCTAATDEITNPSCCCKTCTDGFVPACPLGIDGNLSPLCDERFTCGCKCRSNKVCGNKCCPNATDKCDANGNCCAYGVVDGKCCAQGQAPAKCADTTQFKCCPAGEECEFSFISNSWQRVCCKTGFWDANNDVCCPTRMCNTKAGPECCKSPKSCKFAGNFGVCCTTAAFVGNKCCSGATPLASLPCPDGSKICCPTAANICYADDAGNNACCPPVRWDDATGCCPEERWTGAECCPPGQWNCDGICVGPGAESGLECCIHTDCPRNVPSAMSIAEEDCPDCYAQDLCCNGKCISPTNDQCGDCDDKCPSGSRCLLNRCVPDEAP